MKIPALMNLAKKSKAIRLYEEDKKQWISFGGAAYAIHGLPKLDEDSLCIIAGIPEDKRGTYRIDIDPDFLPIFDNADYGLMLEIKSVLLVHSGVTMTALVDEAGDVYQIDTKYLKPLSDYDADDALSFTLFDKESDPTILVRAGLLNIAVIMPVRPSSAMLSELAYISQKLGKGMEDDKG